MRTLHIDLRQLRHLIALVEQRSFVAAANVVNLSQSAFSRSIQALEHSVGCQLVDRADKQLAPTQQGLVVLEHARRLVSAAQQLSNEINQFNDLESGELHFGCGPAPATGVVPQAVGRFIGRYPKAQVQFKVDDWHSLNKALLNDEIEFFVADTRQFEANPDYQIIRLRAQRWYFCCRAGHPLSQLSSISAAQLMDYPLAVTMRPPNLRKVIVELSGRPDFSPNVQCENSFSLISVVLNSDAVGIIAANSDIWRYTENALSKLHIDGLSEEQEELYTRYGIVSRAGYRLSPMAQAMIEHIQAIDNLPQAHYQLAQLAV